jgi:7-cyano-7-deazaguanine synthase
MEQEKAEKQKLVRALGSHREDIIQRGIHERELATGKPIATATIYIGVHADDGVNWAYPDCTPEFIGAMANAIYIGTYHKVRIRAPLQYDAKPDVVAKGNQLGVDFKNTWSCYKGEGIHCGTCPTCRSRKEAFELTGIPDPTEYQQ